MALTSNAHAPRRARAARPTSPRGTPRPRPGHPGARLLACAALAVAFAGAGALGRAPRAQADAVVVTVGPQGCDHATIQAAVDAAPAGARVRVLAGDYPERVRIEKPLTLEGAGWTATRLHAAYVPAPAAGTRPAPALLVRGGVRVVLRGLRIGLDGEPREGVSFVGAAVDLEASEVLMEACAVVPSPASGIDVSGDADVRIERCLVAAVDATGIAIGSRGAGMPRVRVVDCDVRFGHHRGITVGAACDDVVIEGCRISGSAWHGIRYDDASPTIRRNRITDNVRSAIYASGRTRATLEGNLFADTGLGGVGCWQACGDRILRNTFAHNARAHLEILGAASPTVERNVFHGSRVGVRWSGIAGRGGEVPSAALGTVRENVFWANDEDTSNPLSDEDGNVRLDPALGADGVLAPDGPARARGAGASALPPAESPFPVQPEEAAARRLFERHMARHGSWGQPEEAVTAAPRPGGPLEAQARARRQAAAREKAQAWRAALRSLGESAAREQALAEILAAIGGEDPDLHLAALQQARWLGSIPYDGAAFRARILPHANSADPAVRHAARAALVGVLPTPDDLPLWLDEAQHADRSTAETVAQDLVLLADGVVQGEVADAVLHLLRDGTPIKKAFVIRGLQQADHLDPRVLARLIEIVRSVPAHDYDSAYYFHFISARMDPKPDAVVDLILDRVGEGQGELQTMLRGLRVGLSEAQRQRAADRLLTFAQNAGSEHAQREVLRALAWVASAPHVAPLEALAEREDLDASVRALLDAALEAARGR